MSSLAHAHAANAGPQGGKFNQRALH